MKPKKKKATKGKPVPTQLEWRANTVQLIDALVEVTAKARVSAKQLADDMASARQLADDLERAYLEARELSDHIYGNMDAWGFDFLQQRPRRRVAKSAKTKIRAALARRMGKGRTR